MMPFDLTLKDMFADAGSHGKILDRPPLEELGFFIPRKGLRVALFKRVSSRERVLSSTVQKIEEAKVARYVRLNLIPKFFFRIGATYDVPPGQPALVPPGLL